MDGGKAENCDKKHIISFTACKNIEPWIGVACPLIRTSELNWDLGPPHVGWSRGINIHDLAVVCYLADFDRVPSLVLYLQRPSSCRSCLETRLLSLACFWRSHSKAIFS